MQLTKESQILSVGLEKMGLCITATAQQQLLDYVAELASWNTKVNLTAVREPKKMITHHILDSFTLLPYLDDVKSVLDIGTGAGLPGIPLAIARPDISFILLDSIQKKIKFVQHVVTSLQLQNVDTNCARAETLTVAPEMIVTRAVASLGDLAKLMAKISTAQTKIIAMKGRIEQAELEAQQLPAGFKVLKIEEVVVPGLDAQRCLVFLNRS